MFLATVTQRSTCILAPRRTKVNFRVIVKQLTGGGYYARCNAAPRGVAEAGADTREEALEKVRNEIRYQLEYCPCSAVADDYVELQVVEQAPPRGSAGTRLPTGPQTTGRRGRF